MAFVSSKIANFQEKSHFIQAISALQFVSPNYFNCERCLLIRRSDGRHRCVEQNTDAHVSPQTSGLFLKTHVCVAFPY